MRLMQSSYDRKMNYFKTINLKEAFEEQALNNSKGICAIEHGKKYTYQDINTQANKLAHYLNSHSVLIGEYILI